MTNQVSNTLNKYDLLKKPPSDLTSYIKTQEDIYTDIITTPMFNDEDINIEKWGIDFFHQETKDELSWVVAISLMNLVNKCGYQISHLIDNEDLKNIIVNQENMCLGKSSITMKSLLTGELSNIELVIEDD